MILVCTVDIFEKDWKCENRAFFLKKNITKIVHKQKFRGLVFFQVG